MSRFPAEWLALRERHDVAARNPGILDAVTLSLNARPSVRVLDLACGSGSTVRTLHSRFPTQQHWDLVDNDPDLLALARNAARENGITLNTVRLDLDRDLETALDGRIDLITISALLDLVSQAWLDRFLSEVGARGLPVYAALTYDGRTDQSPADPLDATMIAAVNAHQRTDKGFGPALGPLAADAAIVGFERLGYSVVSGDSDWVIGPDDQAMQTELLNGWAGAVREMKTMPETDIDDWLARREAMVAAGRSSMRVGHVDVFAFPSSTR
jgi:SAM-dependent methyltransferase